MPLKDQITADIKSAMLAKDELKLSTLRMAKADIMKFEVSGSSKKEATDQDVIDLLKRGIKQRREAADGFTQGGNAIAAQKEMDEIKILETYLPEQMSEDAVRDAAKKILADANATPADFGKAMGAVMAQLKGKADGAIISKVVKELLQ